MANHARWAAYAGAAVLCRWQGRLLMIDTALLEGSILQEKLRSGALPHKHIASTHVAEKSFLRY